MNTERQNEYVLPPQSSPAGTSLVASTVDKDEVDFVDFLMLVLRGKGTILRFALSFMVLAALIVYVILKPTYTGEAVFLPPQGAPGSSMTQLAGSIGAMGAVGALAGLKNPGDVYAGILMSRTISDALVKKFDLQNVYKVKLASDASKILTNHTKVTVGKTSLVTIKVDDHDPRRAADLANGYLDELREQNTRLALSDAAQRRLFFQQQLEREKNSLADAEVDLKTTQEKTGLIVPINQAQVQIEEMAQIRAQIASNQVELAALRQGATEQNPQVIRLQSQIEGLRHQLEQLQNNPGKPQPGSIEFSTVKAPTLTMEYIRKQREVRYHELLFELIAKQYENARIDESRESPVLQVVDRATVPERKSGLSRTLTVLGAGVIGGIFGVLYLLLQRSIAKMKADPATASKLNELNGLLGLRRS